MSFLYEGPTNIPPLIFSMLYLGIFAPTNINHDQFFFKSLYELHHKSSLICSGGKMIFSTTKGVIIKIFLNIHAFSLGLLFSNPVMWFFFDIPQ